MLSKWIFDPLVSLVGLLILWPVLVIVSILVKVNMPGGPAFFVQKRVGKDGKLSIDKEKFAAADKSRVQDLFAERRSYAANVNVSAAMIQSTAGYDAARANTYTAAGSYSPVTGSLWDSTT